MVKTKLLVWEINKRSYFREDDWMTKSSNITQIHKFPSVLAILSATHKL